MAQAAEVVPRLGGGVPQGQVLVAGDGGQASAAALVTAAAAVPGPSGLTDDQVRYLTRSMIAGNTYAHAKTALNATLQPTQQPTDAAYAGWQATVTARAAMNPPYYAA